MIHFSLLFILLRIKLPCYVLWISIGTSETLGRGAVQYMSAGSGIRHSEMNSSDELYVHYSFYRNFRFTEASYKETSHLKPVKLICYYAIEADIKLSWPGCASYKSGSSPIQEV